MTEILCESLDDFLDDGLSVEHKSLFLVHLDDCDECRSATRDWHALKRTLKLATIQSAGPSNTLLQRITLPAKIAVAGHRPLRSKQTATLAAVLILLGSGSWWIWNERSQQDLRPHPQSVTATVEVPPPGLTQPSVTVTSPENVIGVPIDVGDPNVIVVWVYPTIPVAHADSMISKMLPYLPPDARRNP